MAASTYARGLAVSDSEHSNFPRHPAVVRVTHWLTVLAFFGLLFSGIAILLAHPRLYWGETGAVGTPSLIDLPLPFVRDVPIRGPGRYVHFLSAWVCVLAGVFYVLFGIISGHFRRDLMPSRVTVRIAHILMVVSDHLKLKRPTEVDASTYNVLQRLAYLAVVFIVLPSSIWTGLAMSPAITSVTPWIATIFGGQQSARTIHFFLAFLLVLFFIVHIAMVCLAGFTGRVRAMITGRIRAVKEHA